MRILRRSLIACLVAASAASAQHKKSGLAGVVRDSTGAPISHVNVFVATGNAADVTDDSGHFDVRGLPGGPNEVTIAKIGFSPVSFTATLPNDSVVVVAITLHRVQVLDPVSVTAVAARERLARSGFYDRRRAGWGQYLTPEHVDSIADRLVHPSELLRDLRGIDLRCGRATCVPIAHNARCLGLYVDGEPMGSAAQLDELGYTPSSIGAVEFYDTPATVPMEYHRVDGCAVVLLWTKLKVSK